ncbi:MAG TPA: DUF559 domain-containing protein [Solirubrobacterales bacterium]|nr:DUF559 domain-containing protein [Solirubrobacterales bacterium]
MPITARATGASPDHSGTHPRRLAPAPLRGPTECGGAGGGVPAAPDRQRPVDRRTRTELEHRMLSLCRRHRLPWAEVNANVHGFEVDFLWREQRLIAEVDGWDSHRSRSAFEQDRARDAQLAVLGYEVVRFTWRQLTGDPAAVATTIRALISARPV